MRCFSGRWAKRFRLLLLQQLQKKRRNHSAQELIIGVCGHLSSPRQLVNAYDIESSAAVCCAVRHYAVVIVLYAVVDMLYPVLYAARFFSLGTRSKCRRNGLRTAYQYLCADFETHSRNHSAPSMLHMCGHLSSPEPPSARLLKQQWGMPVLLLCCKNCERTSRRHDPRMIRISYTRYI